MTSHAHHRTLLFPALAVAIALAASTVGAQPAHAAGCAGIEHSGPIAANETWCAGPDTHVLVNQVTVLPGVTLTIDPGVTVRAQWGDYITIQGHLDVQGTLAQPVTLRAEVPDPGQVWGGLVFDGTQGDGSGTISHAVIQEAGTNLGGYGGAQHAVLVKDLAAGKQVTISDSTIRDNASKGLYVVNSTVSVTNTAFTGQKYPILLEGASTAVSFAGNSFSGNAFPYYDNQSYTINDDAIFVGPGAMTGHDFTLPAQTGLDAYVFGAGTTVPAGRTMTVEPGVTVQVEHDQFLTVQGHLAAPGTAAHPIRFQAMPPFNAANPLYWGGLFFDGSAGGGTGSLAHVTIAHGGSNFAAPACTGACPAQNAVSVKGVGAGRHVDLDASTIDRSLVTGLRVTESTVSVTGTTLSDNPLPVRISGASSAVSFAGNTFSGNSATYVALDPGAMTDHNVTLPKQTGLGFYFLTDTYTLPAGRTMTVEPGVTVRTAGNKFLVVQGDLQAVGTQMEPILFSDQGDDSGWGGLIFDGPSGGRGHLDRTILERGTQFWRVLRATVLIDRIAADAALIIERSTVRDSGEWGIGVIDSPTAKVDGNIIRNGRHGLYLATSMTVRNVALLDQALDGLYVETGSTVDARHMTITGAGQGGLTVNSGGVATLRNAILAGNTVAVRAAGTGTATLDTFLADANATFSIGTGVTVLHQVSGSAGFEADGYHVGTVSDGVGKGLAELAPADIDGDLRPAPAGTLPDLGADEVAQGVEDDPPTVVAITRAGPSPTGAASVAFTVTFSEAVAGVDASDFVVAQTGVSGAAISAVDGTGTTRSVTVGTGTGNGTIHLDLVDDDTILDLTSNSLGGTGSGNGSFTAGESYVVSRTLTVTIASSGARDGWIRESRESSGKGGTRNATAATVRLGDDASRRQYRSVLSFATGASLPDNAIITRVTLKVRRQGVVGGGNPVTAFKGFMVDLKKGPFGTTALQVGDFRAAAGRSFGPFTPSLSGGWYSITLTSGASTINRLSSLSGVTDLRLRLKLDDNNNRTANYLNLYSGNATTASRPRLVIEYHLP